MTTQELCIKAQKAAADLALKNVREWNAIRNCYSMTWTIVHLTYIGLVVPCESARPRLEDFVRALESALTK